MHAKIFQHVVAGVRRTVHKKTTTCGNSGSNRFACVVLLCEDNSERANKQRSDGRGHSRPIQGRLPSSACPKNSQGLRAASGYAPTDIRALRSRRNGPKGLRGVPSQQRKNPRTNTKGSATSRPIGRLHPSCLILVLDSGQSPTGRKEAEELSTGSVNQGRGVRATSGYGANTCSPSYAAGAIHGPATRRHPELSVVGPTGSGDRRSGESRKEDHYYRAEHLSIKDQKAAGYPCHAEAGESFGRVLDAEEWWTPGERIHTPNKERTSLYFGRLQGRLAKMHASLDEYRRRKFPLPRYPRLGRHKMQDSRNRNALVRPYHLGHDDARISKRRRESRRIGSIA